MSISATSPKFQLIMRCGKIMLEEYYMRKYGIKDHDTIIIKSMLDNDHHSYAIEILTLQSTASGMEKEK